MIKKSLKKRLLHIKSSLIALNFVQNSIHYAISDGFFGVHPVVTVKIIQYFFNSLAAIFGQYFGTQVFCLKYLVSHDLQVGACALATAAWLVDHYFAIGIYKTFAFCPAA